jgi:general secretion pathway protein D
MKAYKIIYNIIVCLFTSSLLIAANGCAVKENVKPDETIYSEKARPKKKMSLDRLTPNDLEKSTPDASTGKKEQEIKQASDRLDAEKPSAPGSQLHKASPGHSRPASIQRRPKLNKPPARRSGKTPGSIVLNFDNADLYEVIRAMAELLNINYITAPDIRGAVTIHSAGGLTKEDLFPVFFQILELNGYTAVKEGELYRIIPLADAARLPITSRLEYTGEALPPGERFMIQIVPLNYIDVQEMISLLTPFLSAQGSIVSHTDSNTLLIVDKSDNVHKVLKLVDVFDINIFGKVAHKMYPLTYINAADAVKLLKEIIDSYGKAAGKDTEIIPIERLNMLLVLSPNPLVFDKIREYLALLDVAGNDIEPRIYVYAVRNSEAANLAALLNSVFTGKPETKVDTEKIKQEEQAKPETKKESVETPFGTIKPKTDVRAEVEKATADRDSGTLRQQVRITADEERNALIIEAIPKDYKAIEKILKRLDVLPRQVLIEVTIADIQLDAKTELGISWNYSRGDGSEPTIHLLSASAASDGLNYMIGQNERLTQALQALATESRVNIISSPTILASDNKEASIDISTEIPIASSTTRYESGSIPITQTDVQYRNTGVILSVTPHINEFGLVSMDIDQEVSNELEDSVQVGSESMPKFFKRSIKTSLTVSHGQTIVIGGMIRETKNQGYAGLPCLGQIPVARWIAGKETDSSEKTELIILITPRVIANLSDVDAVTEEFKDRLGKAMEFEDGLF